MRRITGLGFMLAMLVTVPAMPAADSRVSSFGVYSGFSSPTFDGYVRTSQYVRAGDGTRLAVDVYRPTLAGRVSDLKMPVVWTFTPYNRATREGGRIVPTDDVELNLLPYGYVIAIADVRGKGASFGVRKGPADSNETSDARDITEWLAVQPWSNGKIGMQGCSYFGATALEGLHSGAPHLRAAFVGTTMFDQYGTFAQGGVTSSGLLDDTVPADQVVEVDADKDRKLLGQALEGHAANTKTGTFFASTPFRDDINPYTHTPWWRDASFYPYTAGLSQNVGLYLYGGYYDLYADQTLLKYRAVNTPKKLAFGNWVHCETPGFRMDVERLRFFDYWLKGVDNGVMSEAPVHVYVGRAQDGTEWRALKDWPDEKRDRYYLVSQPAPATPEARGVQESLVPGRLSETEPAAGARATELNDVPTPQPLVIYGTVRASVDPYSATFTLPPQTQWHEVIGSPVVRLWVATAATDADLYVYLEHVDRMGGAQVISRGVLRASHRKTGVAPYDTGGLPWQTHRRADYAQLRPNEPVALDIALSPTAYTFRDGDLLRLAVTTRAPDEDKPAAVPALRILSDAAHPSYLELPTGDTRAQAMNPDVAAGRYGPMPVMTGAVR